MKWTEDSDNYELTSTKKKASHTRSLFDNEERKLRKFAHKVGKTWVTYKPVKIEVV